MSQLSDYELQHMIMIAIRSTSEGQATHAIACQLCQIQLSMQPLFARYHRRLKWCIDACLVCIIRHLRASEVLQSAILYIVTAHSAPARQSS